MHPDIQTALNTVFASDTELYQNRGFQRRIGWGKKPALINIDLANAWTREGNAFTCVGMDTILPATQEVLAAFRARGLPIVFTTTAYDIVEGEHTDMGLWGKKIPAEVLRVGTEAVEIDSRLERRDDELLIVKKQASAFRGTNLNSYLNACGVDTTVLSRSPASEWKIFSHVSSPAKSAIRSGPVEAIRSPSVPLTAASISSADAMPDCKIAQASRRRASWRRCCARKVSKTSPWAASSPTAASRAPCARRMSTRLVSRKSSPSRSAPRRRIRPPTRRR